MTRRTRKGLFYALVALFFVVGGAVVLYAQGWRIDLSTLRTRKVGAIFVRSFPINADITLDGKPVRNQTNFLSQGTLISNLFPKNYSLTLNAPGYDAWAENLDVLPSLVTELKYAVLIPQTGTRVGTSTAISNFFEVSDDPVLQTASGTIVWRGKTIAEGTIVSHSTDLKTMIVLAPNETYTVYDFTAQTLSKLNGSFISVMVDPYDAETAFATTKTRVVRIDLATLTVTTVATISATGTLTPSLAASPSLLAWAAYNNASNTSAIATYDLFAQTSTNASAVVPGGVTKLAWIKNNLLGIGGTAGSLYRWDTSANAPATLADDVKDFFPSDDGAMIATLENHSIEVFSLTNDDYYRFNLPDMGSIENLAWYKDNAHLFVQYPDHVAFLDLKDSGLHNLTTVSAGTAMQYDAKANALYLIASDGTLVRFDFSQ